MNTPPTRKLTPQKRLAKRGGRVFPAPPSSGRRLWIARLKGKQGHGPTEEEAIENLLKQFDKIKL